MSNETVSTFAEWLRESRHTKGLSRLEVAEKVGVSEQYIAKLEQAVKNPSPKLKVKLEDLFTKKADMPTWMWMELEKVAEEIGSTPGDIINTLVYQFIKGN